MTRQEYCNSAGLHLYHPIPDGDKEADDDFKDQVDNIVTHFMELYNDWDDEDEEIII